MVHIGATNTCHDLARWHAENGFMQNAFRSQQRPIAGLALTERQGNKRIQHLHSAEEVSRSTAVAVR